MLLSVRDAGNARDAAVRPGYCPPPALQCPHCHPVLSTADTGRTVNLVRPAGSVTRAAGWLVLPGHCGGLVFRWRGVRASDQLVSNQDNKPVVVASHMSKQSLISDFIGGGYLNDSSVLRPCSSDTRPLFGLHVKWWAIIQMLRIQ